MVEVYWIFASTLSTSSTCTRAGCACLRTRTLRDAFAEHNGEANFGCFMRLEDAGVAARGQFCVVTNTAYFDLAVECISDAVYVPALMRKRNWTRDQNCLKMVCFVLPCVKQMLVGCPARLRLAPSAT